MKVDPLIPTEAQKRRNARWKGIGKGFRVFSGNEYDKARIRAETREAQIQRKKDRLQRTVCSLVVSAIYR